MFLSFTVVYFFLFSNRLIQHNSTR